MTTSNRSGILGYTHELSDDGQFAIVEFVAASPEALLPILNAALPNITVFVKGKHSKEEIETQLKKFKKNFDIEKFGVRLP